MDGSFGTAIGGEALFNNLSGEQNVGVGFRTLYANTTGSRNTGMGYRTLAANDLGSDNTAIGWNALFNSRGHHTDQNTAVGSQALFTNTSGVDNTAVGTLALLGNTDGDSNNALGAFALQNNTIGGSNEAVGAAALFNNIKAFDNVAIGDSALYNNDSTGHGVAAGNTAVGTSALFSNTDGGSNTAVGQNALFANTGGNFNTAIGYDAGSNGNNNTTVGVNTLLNVSQGDNNTVVGVNALKGASIPSVTGGDTAIGNNALTNVLNATENTAIGDGAGANLTSGNFNVYIGAGVGGVSIESNTTRIRNVYNSVASARAVYVNSDNKIGTLSSSRRYKEQIKPMEHASETLFALKPVTYRYKKEVDSTQALSFGLIAEEVAKVNPELITLDEQGRPQTVRYEAVNAMLLNEFLKEHKKVEEQQVTIAELKGNAARQEKLSAQQQKQIESLTAGLQQVSAQLAAASPSDGALAVSKSAKLTVLNNP